MGFNAVHGIEVLVRIECPYNGAVLGRVGTQTSIHLTVLEKTIRGISEFVVAENCERTIDPLIDGIIRVSLAAIA